jgi:hypothetical protein
MKKLILLSVLILSGCASLDQMDQRDKEKIVKVLLKRYN